MSKPLREHQQALHEMLAQSPIKDGSYTLEPVGVVGRSVTFLPTGELSDRLMVSFSLMLPKGQQDLSDEQMELIGAIQQALFLVFQRTTNL